MFKHNLHENEKLLQVYRKHEMTLVPKILQIFVLIFIPWYLGLKYDFIFSSRGHANIFLIWTLLVALYAIQAFLIWTVNVYLVTDKRLLHIEHDTIFKKSVVETPLDRILNVSFRTTGFFSTLFHFGDVTVQVVGLDQPLILKSVPNPAQVKDFLWKMHIEFSGEQKVTYTQPEIAPVDRKIPYAPSAPKKVVLNKKRNVL